MFEFISKPTKVVRVKFLRRASARGVDDGIMAGRDVGTELDVTTEDAATLGDSVEVLGRVAADGALATRKPHSGQPATYQRDPVPARFAELPACFTEYWNLQQTLAGLRFKAAVAEKALGVSRYTSVNSEEVNGEMGIAVRRFVQARDAVNAFNVEQAQRALLACSKAVTAEIDAANATRDELERIAFEVFSMRSAPLELSEEHARRIFSGSGLYRTYVQPPMMAHDMRSAGHGHRYMDAPLSTIAARVFAAREMRAKLAPLLVKAKAERDTAARVMRQNAKQFSAA